MSAYRDYSGRVAGKVWKVPCCICQEALGHLEQKHPEARMMVLQRKLPSLSMFTKVGRAALADLVTSAADGLGCSRARF